MALISLASSKSAVLKLVQDTDSSGSYRTYHPYGDTSDGVTGHCDTECIVLLGIVTGVLLILFAFSAYACYKDWAGDKRKQEMEAEADYAESVMAYRKSNPVGLSRWDTTV
eukprot:CAMPEP_0115019698 /NCGR_PEP_ID=MMETSP0216-20121206/29615_1 /TAXON_ID=223996 /ORGANISM="Protocruzia adherens, Strain Boccale" /LENGTH=110 /DNA_ID=CAMNT_0002391251 /DNA_START=73 /DNA_END=405 /DNA_ORIENTATION=+